MGEWGDALFTMYQGSKGLSGSNCEYMEYAITICIWPFACPIKPYRTVVRLLLLGTYVTLRSSFLI